VRDRRGLMGIALIAVLGLCLGGEVALADPPPEETIGTSDTLFTPPSAPSPIAYVTSYDRDVSTGTWSQSLSYSFFRPRVVFNATGNYATIDQVANLRQSAGSGYISGRLDFRATKNWVLTADGRFNKASSRDPYSESTQRQNRLKVTSQYSLAPVRSLSIRTLLSSEFQEDHALGIRPPGQELTRFLTTFDPSGNPVVDTFLVQRDSTITTGRQDGLTGVVDWKPTMWFQMVTTATGDRVRPTTKSHLGGFESGSPTFGQRLTSAPGSINDNLQYQTKMTYRGQRGLLSTLSLTRVRSDQEYYDRSALIQERLSLDQRGGILHAEQSLARVFLVSVDGILRRSFSQYRSRDNRNSLVKTKSMKTGLLYTPSPRSRAGLEFDVDHNRNSRQQNGNGSNVSRFAQATGGRQVSKKLSLEGTATASLTSFKYERGDSVLDQDNARGYVNVGGSYQVSASCNTVVHFSTTRGHNVAIDPARSSNNNVQSTYQMDASLRLDVNPRIKISQIYVLNALYQIYDQASAESKNTLSRIRRIDTTVSDSLFEFASLQLIHNFLSRDFGTFSRQPGETERVYRVASETFVQTVSATLNLRPAPGFVLFATQSLSNTRVNSPFGNAHTNRWNLQTGASVNRTILGDATLQGTATHIGAYDERQVPGAPLNEQDDWVAGVTFSKQF
jgi:hypothetical protein